MSRDSRQYSIQINPMLFSEALRLFNCPLSAEQTWSVAYSIALSVKSHGFQNIAIDADCVYFEPAGAVSFKNVEKETNITELLYSLGKLLFHALDYNLPVDEERGDLPELLEDFLDRLIENEDVDNDGGDCRSGAFSDDEIAPDEGFAPGPDDILRPGDDKGRIRSFSQVMRVCYAAAIASKGRKGMSFESAHAHFVKVCQAIFQEASDLSVFLDKVEAAQQVLMQTREVSGGNVLFKERDLEDLRSTEWARLWMQVMRQLRTGVTLKKAEDRHYTPHDIVYELTPYEVLMEDIRCKRYNLKKISNISPKLRKDAHDIILEFIRSRPTLKPVTRRSSRSSTSGGSSSFKGSSKSNSSTEIITARDTMLNLIRTRPNLKHIQTPNYNRGLQLGRVVDIMKDGNKRYEGTRLLIRPASIMNLDIEDVSCTEDEGCDQDDTVFTEQNFASPVLGHKKSTKSDSTLTSQMTRNASNGKNDAGNFIAECFKDKSLIPTVVDDIDAFCEISHAGLQLTTDSEIEDEREENTPTPQASSLEDIVKEFSSHNGVGSSDGFRNNMDRSTSMATNLCINNKGGNEANSHRRTARLSVGNYPEDRDSFPARAKPQPTPGGGLGRRVYSPRDGRQRKRDSSAGGLPRGGHKSSSSGLRGSNNALSASGSSGFGRRRGVRGSEESLLSAARSVGGGLGEGGTSECKMCNEGVDGRDFLNLTVDEMMHIRQVLTKAELDNLSLAKDLLADVRSECVCFLCKTTRFNMFKKKFTCKFCAKSVCKSCCRSIQMPSTNLLRVPITILSPTPSRVVVANEKSIPSYSAKSKSRDCLSNSTEEKCLSTATASGSKNRYNKSSDKLDGRGGVESSRRSSLIISGSSREAIYGRNRRKSRHSDLPLRRDSTTEDEDEPPRVRCLSSSSCSSTTSSSSGDETCPEIGADGETTETEEDADASIVGSYLNNNLSGLSGGNATPRSGSPMVSTTNLTKIPENNSSHNTPTNSFASAYNGTANINVNGTRKGFNRPSSCIAKPIVANKSEFITETTASNHLSRKSSAGHEMNRSNISHTNNNLNSNGGNNSLKPSNGVGVGGFRRASSAQYRSHQNGSVQQSNPNSSHLGNQRTDVSSREPPSGCNSNQQAATLASYGISATPPSAAPAQPRTQVCRSCHKFLKHVLHTNTCSNYFSRI